MPMFMVVMVMVVMVMMIVVIVVIMMAMVMRGKMGINSWSVGIYRRMVMFLGEARRACGVGLPRGVRLGMGLMIVGMLIVLMKRLRV